MPKKPPLISKVILFFKIVIALLCLVVYLSWFSSIFGFDVRTMNVLTLILLIGLWERYFALVF